MLFRHNQTKFAFRFFRVLKVMSTRARNAFVGLVLVGSDNHKRQELARPHFDVHFRHGMELLLCIELECQIP